MKFQDFRKKYPRFIYEKYSWRISKNNLEILFDFRIEPDIFFRPKIVIENVGQKEIKRVGENVLNNLVFNLGLMEMPSYWKATCSPEILIEAGYLNQEQINWWKSLFIKGLGQFYYENKINFKSPNFLKISSLQRPVLCKTYRGPSSAKLKNQVLVPVGGGKDSAVTLELLKRTGENIRCFSLNPTGAALKTMKVAGCKPRTRTSSVRGKNPIIVIRKIDKKLLELNRKGFLNGHTPFSAYLAFLSVLAAAIFENKYVALSNERSSNEGNVKYLGRIINHQWSKSFEFEQKFRNYCKRYLAKEIEYFSFLRPLYEIQTAKLFGKYPEYFPVFLSCNEAYKTASGTKFPAKNWCGKCSKCLFVFTILYPFVKDKELIKIFGKNLFKDKTLLPIMQELMGERGFKPFECVGTKKESLIAFYLSYKKYIGGTHGELPFLLKYFEDKILNSLPRRISSISERFMRGWNNQNNLPEEFKKIIKT